MQTPMLGFQSQAEYTPIAAVMICVLIGAWLGHLGGRPDVWFLGGVLCLAGWWTLRRACRDGWAGLVLSGVLICWMAAYASERWAWRERDGLVHLTRSQGSLVCLDVEILSSQVVAQPSVVGKASTGVARDRHFIQAMRIRKADDWKSTSGLGELRIGAGPYRWLPGERIVIWGVMRKPPAPRNPGAFNYQLFCKTRGVDFLVDVSHWQQANRILAAKRTNPRLLMHNLRLQAVGTLRRLLPAKHFPLAAALVIGQRQGLDRGQRETFLLAGVMHLLAISGLHVGMLVGLVWRAERIGCFTRSWALFAGVGLAGSFALFTGGQAPVLRAAMFVSAFAIARWSARECRSLAVVSAAATLLLLINPASLFDTGVQLSLLAVAVLGCYGRHLVWRESSDPLDQLISQSRPWWSRALRALLRGCCSLMLTSLAVCLATAPLTSRVFHVAAPAAVVLNLVLGPLTAIVLLSGLATCALESTLGVGWTPAQICSLAIAGMLNLLELSEQFAWASCWTCGPPRWWMIGFYLLFGLATWLPSKPSLRISGVVLAVWCVAAPIAWRIESGRQPSLRCTVLSMGHGACVLIQTPNRKTLVYDLGSLGAPNSAGNRAVQACWAQHVGRIDAIMLSHADSDHFNGLLFAAERIRMQRLFVSAAFLRDRRGMALAERVSKLGVAILKTRDGQQVAIDPDVRIDVLQPDADAQSTDNSKSLLLRIEYRGQRILLTGDLESEGMQRLLRGPPETANVVLAPHHGSRHSEPQRFLAWSQPEFVIASTGRGRSLSALADACQAHKARLFSTAEDGAVQVEIDNNGRLTVRSWRHSHWATF